MHMWSFHLQTTICFVFDFLQAAEELKQKEAEKAAEGKDIILETHLSVSK